MTTKALIVTSSLGATSVGGVGYGGFQEYVKEFGIPIHERVNAMGVLITNPSDPHGQDAGDRYKLSGNKWGIKLSKEVSEEFKRECEKRSQIKVLRGGTSPSWSDLLWDLERGCTRPFKLGEKKMGFREALSGIGDDEKWSELFEELRFRKFLKREKIVGNIYFSDPLDILDEEIENFQRLRDICKIKSEEYLEGGDTEKNGIDREKFGNGCTWDEARPVGYFKSPKGRRFVSGKDEPKLVSKGLDTGLKEVMYS